MEEIRKYHQTLIISDFIGRDFQDRDIQIFKLDSKDIKEKFEESISKEHQGYVHLVSPRTYEETSYFITHIGYSLRKIREEISFEDYIRLGRPRTIERLVVLSSSDTKPLE